MAKNMARIKNGVVTNVEWCAHDTPESEFLKEFNDIPVIIGDTWKDGKFYRNGAEVLNPLEKTLRENEEYVEALAVLGVDV